MFDAHNLPYVSIYIFFFIGSHKLPEAIKVADSSAFLPWAGVDETAA